MKQLMSDNILKIPYMFKNVNFFDIYESQNKMNFKKINGYIINKVLFWRFLHGDRSYKMV